MKSLYNIKSILVSRIKTDTSYFGLYNISDQIYYIKMNTNI